MTALQRRLLAALSVMVGASGLAYLWMEYFMEASDPFAVVNHPWQPYMLYVHILSAPALVLMFGIIWSAHVTAKIDGGQPYNRRSGLVSAWTFVVMVASGYLLQVLTSERLHFATMVAHVASGTLFLIMYAAHIALSLRHQRRQRRAEPIRPAA